MENSTKVKINQTISKGKEKKHNHKVIQVIRKQKKILIGLVLLCILIYAFDVVMKLIKNPTNTFLVEQGQIYEEEMAIGYIMRDETVIKGKKYKNGMSQIKTEGERVAKGEDIFRYYSSGENSLVKKIEELDKKIDEAMASGDKLSSGDTKVLENQIDEKINDCRNESNLTSVRENKKQINTYITKKAKIAGDLSPSGSYLRKLINQRKNYENSLNSGAERIKAPISGVVSYRVDGFEEILSTKDFGKISKNFLEGLNLKTGQIITANNESGKIINNYECYIATILNSEYAKNAEVGKKVKLRLQNGKEIPAEIEYINSQEDENVLIFKIQKSIEELIRYRKISLEIIWWSESGKKIPNSAIKYEEKGENKIAYVIRTRAGYQDKIWIKELKTNGKYTIVTDYTSEELKELGYTSEEMKARKKISLYDEILINL